MSTSKLMKVTYYDPKSQIRLLCYADTVVWDTKPTPTLTALRFGGYPERVQGLADAIYGGATIEIEDGKDTYSLKTLTRQYRRELSHDGVYAEATLIAEDDGQSAKQNAGDKDEPDKDKNDEDDDQIQQDLPPRNTYIFCTPGERRELFDAVDQKTAVPMIPEYQDYVLTELQKRNILRPLQVKSLSRKLEAWLLRCEEKDKNIVAVMEDGLKSGAISIPGATVGLNPLDEINSITEYLNTFGVTVAERIKKLFVPLFDPATESLSPEVLAINQYIEDHAGYPLYDAQLAVAEAIKRQLERSKVGLIVAECGSGKSKIGAVSIAATAAGLLSHQMSVKVSKTFNLILCPSHVTEKWVRELEETVPNAFAAVVHTPAELDHLYQMFERGNKFCFAVLSKEKARDGYMRAPAVIYRPWNREALPIERNPPLHDGADIDGNPHKPVFCCPECGAVVMAEFTQDGVSYCMKKGKKGRRLGKKDLKRRPPEWCPRRLKTPVCRIYGFKDEMHEALELDNRLNFEPDKHDWYFPSSHHYQLQSEFPLGMTAEQFYNALQEEPVESVLNGTPLKNGELIEIDDGLASHFFYCYSQSTVLPAKVFGLEHEGGAHHA